MLHNRVRLDTAEQRVSHKAHSGLAAGVQYSSDLDQYTLHQKSSRVEMPCHNLV